MKMNHFELFKENQARDAIIITVTILITALLGFATYFINPFYLLFGLLAVIGCIGSLFAPRLFLQLMIITLISTMAINIQSDFPIRLGVDVFISSVLIVRAFIWFFSDAPKNYRIPNVAKFLLLYIISMFLSTLLSPDVIGGISYTFREISYLAFCLMLPAYFSKEKDVFRLLILIILASLPSLVGSIWGLLTNLATLQVIGHKVTYRAQLPGDSGGPWALSAFFLVVIAVSFTLIVYFSKIKNTGKNILTIAFVGMVIVGLISTFYRTGWISFVFMIIVAARRRLKVAVIFTFILLVLYIFIPQVGQRINNIIDPNSTAYGRVEMWVWTLKTMAASPLHFITGYGQSAFYSVLQDVGGAVWMFVPSPHDYYLTVLFSQGIPGLILFILMLYQIYLLSTTISRKTDFPLYQAVGEGLLLALVGMVIMSIATGPFGNPSAIFYFWVLVGIGLLVEKNIKQNSIIPL
jgi:O-antigen ligase